MRSRQPVLITIVLLILFSGFEVDTTAAEKEWGTLRGRVLFDGEAPERKPLPLVVAKPVAVKGPILDESLIVDKESKGVANVVVYLYLKSSEAPPPAHPSYEMIAEHAVRLTAEGGRFEPHVVLLRTTQTLNLANSDPVAHCFCIDGYANIPLHLLVPPKEKMEKKLPNRERLPTPVTCAINPWMRAYLFVQDHPYMALTGADGKFEIRNLPVGKLTFVFWHEQAGYLREVVHGMRAQAWKRGQVDVTIEPGVNEFGDVVVSPDLFEK